MQVGANSSNCRFDADSKIRFVPKIQKPWVYNITQDGSSRAYWKGGQRNIFGGSLITPSVAARNSNPSIPKLFWILTKKMVLGRPWRRQSMHTIRRVACPSFKSAKQDIYVEFHAFDTYGKPLLSTKWGWFYSLVEVWPFMKQTPF